MCIDCNALEIPSRLHKGDREILTNISDEDTLYRRFNSPIPSNFDGNIAAQLTTLFPIRDDSYVLKSLTQSEFDAQYDGLAKSPTEHCMNCGVFAVSIKDATIEHPYQDSKGQDLILKMKPEHDPLKCNYAHCEIRMYDGTTRIPATSQPTNKTHKKIRSAIRVKIFQRITVLHYPTSVS